MRGKHMRLTTTRIWVVTWVPRERMVPRGFQPVGFTLVELLVVIAVLSILLAMLLPTLGDTWSLAGEASCMNNQRSIASAIFAYANDFQGSIPFGPKASPSSIADFYVVDGLVTSQISLLSGGQPVGVGLLLINYLFDMPQVVFCPRADQPRNAEFELAKVGNSQAVCDYFYRHGSNTLQSAAMPAATWDNHTRLDQLGRNRNGAPIHALLMDQQFVVNPPLPMFNIIVRTNHDRRSSNTLYADGHVTSLLNENDRYTANIGNALHLGPDVMLSVFEMADQTQ